MIDFSCKHEVWIRNGDGSLSRMDEPYFQAELVRDGVWQILSSGDYSYLVEGEEEALAIDSGYGAGNIRYFMQTLTEKPVRRIANTHDHFDHTANNSYFELAYMSEATRPLATRPFSSFRGIEFPREYPVRILKDGDYIPLKGRELQAFLIPDHAAGSMAFLDRKGRILFTGDEFMRRGKRLNGGLKSWLGNLEKLAVYRQSFDLLCGGAAIMEAGLFDACLACAQYAMVHEGALLEAGPDDLPAAREAGHRGGSIIYDRKRPHPEDMKKMDVNLENLRKVEYGDTQLIYNVAKKNL